MNNLTNRPVHFRYETFGFEGKQIGIVCINEQIRPIYLRRDYGRLKKEKVYVRRGSSTDPNKPASPEEIAQMGVSTDQPSAELQVEFADIDHDEAVGLRLNWNAEFCKMPLKEEIPHFPVEGPSPLLRPVPSWHLVNLALNRDYYRELAGYEFVRRLFRPVRLLVRNIGRVAARNVRVELTIPNTTQGRLLVKAELPEQPKRRNAVLSISDLAVMRAAPSRSPGDISIENNDLHFCVAISCEDLQPGRKVWSDVFHIAKMRSGEISMAGRLFADNLPQPKEFTLCVSVTVHEKAMSVDELCSLSESITEDD